MLVFINAINPLISQYFAPFAALLVKPTYHKQPTNKGTCVRKGTYKLFMCVCDIITGHNLMKFSYVTECHFAKADIFDEQVLRCNVLRN